jgi:PDZ domain-containing protein
MRRRGITVLVGFLLVAGMTALVGQATVPYVQLEPGPTYDTLGKDDAGKDVIVINGASATSSAGQLRFVTIGVQPDLTLLQALRGWWSGDDAVVPRELFYPPDQSQQQIDRCNTAAFANSGSAARSVALTKLGYSMRVSIKDVAKGAPADGKLQAGDVIVSLNGAPLDTPATLVDTLAKKPAGTTFSFGITRGDNSLTVPITTVADECGVPRVGISPESTSTAPFTLDIPIEHIGGPSAGLMLTLGIIDKVKPEDLTGGKIIAGTGEMHADGTVGEIGGIPQKLVAAKAAGATYFLTPKGNCAEAVANAKPGLTLVRVGTVDDALNALADIRAGRQPTLCTADG